MADASAVSHPAALVASSASLPSAHPVEVSSASLPSAQHVEEGSPAKPPRAMSASVGRLATGSVFGGFVAPSAAAWFSETGLAKPPAAEPAEQLAPELPDEGTPDAVPELPESPIRKNEAVAVDESGIYPSDFEEEDTKDSSF